jgi:hypothetical protein
VSQRAWNVLNLSDKVRILDSLKGNMSLVEVGGIMGKMNQGAAVFKVKSMI